MRLLLIGFSLLLVFGCKSSKFQSDDIPMYGGKNIAGYQIRINNEFIEGIKSKIADKETGYKDLKEVSDLYVQRGWESFSDKNYRSAIKRFNQAWLLDNNNPDVYWGFGNCYGANYEFDDSIRMLKKSLELKKDNVPVMEDLAKSYNMNGLYYLQYDKKDKMTDNFNKAIDIVSKALNIKETGHLYHHWAVSLFYLDKYSEANEKLLKAKALGEDVPEKFFDDIKEKLKIKKGAL